MESYKKKEKIKMSTLKDLKKLQTGLKGEQRARIDWEEEQGYVTQIEAEKPITDEGQDDLLRGFLRERGYDPDEYYILKDTLRISEWQTYDERWLYAYKYQIQKKPEYAADINDVLERIWLQDRASEEPDKDHLVIVLSDTHIGKAASAGGDTPTIIDRWKTGVIKALGDDYYGVVTIMLGGDLIEGYMSQGGKNITECDLNLQEQVTTAVQLVAWTINTVAAQSNKVNILSVPGNHGDTTRFANVELTDSYDIMIPRQVQTAIETYGEDIKDRVSFYYPENQRGSITLPVLDTNLVLVHGHNFSGGVDKGAQNWWQGHIVNSRPESAGHILVYGHFHGFQATAWTKDRWILRAPALETESTWLSNKNGAQGRPGVLSFECVSGEPVNIRIN